MPRRRPRPPYPGPHDPGREPEGDRLRSPLPRLAWRYRSELAPLSLALVLLVAGLLLHRRWPGWWQIVAAVGVGRAKTWVYERLQDLHRQGQVERAGHGRWRAIPGVTEHDREDHR